MKAKEQKQASPCAQCPWRTANHGKKHEFGFYTKKNLTRLWNQIRRGDNAQSCHPTDPSHADHKAPAGAKTAECAGSVIVVLREVRKASEVKDEGRTCEVTPESIDAYKASRKRGLTATGIRYWIIARIGFGGVPFFGNAKIPPVDVDHPDVSLPEFLGEK